jgi:CPA2 family monovalent cation:H+ antiporter-2
MRDAFAVLFFVSVGMGFQMGGLVEYWPLALGTTAYVLLIKPVTGYVVIRLLRRPARLGVVVGGALAQIGEFSFILATLAASTYGVLPLYAANVITGAAIISITLNAALFRYVPRLIHLLEKNAPVPADAGRHLPPPSETRHRVIVVGYGPSGQIMTDLLQKYDVEVVVLEMNIDTVTQLNAAGIPALHGDARLRHILKLAGVEHAQAIMVTAAAAPSKEIASAARSLNKKIQVMAYTTYMSQAQELRTSGHAIFSGEEEVALSMSSTLLRQMGATDEQVTRERVATRRRLAGLPPEELADM